jgi:HEAT repeat protein
MRETNDVLGLLNTLRNRNPEKPPDDLYWAIENALIDIGHKDITPFIKLIDNKELRRLVFWALMKIKDPSTTELLIGAIADEDENVRYIAVHSLGEFGDKRALIPLNDLKIENDSNFKELVGEAIASINTRISLQ